MTDRDRLIELIKASVYGNIDEGFYGPELNSENVADYLLANGVVVSPCENRTNERGGDDMNLIEGATINPSIKIHLKPCPFCGETHKLHIRKLGNRAYRVICHNCGALGPCAKVEPWHSTKFIAQNQAKTLWNTRK